MKEGPNEPARAAEDNENLEKYNVGQTDCQLGQELLMQNNVTYFQFIKRAKRLFLFLHGKGLTFF